jgi:hypothetical protein
MIPPTSRLGWRRLLLSSASLLFLVAAPACSDDDASRSDSEVVAQQTATVESVALTACTTMVVRGLAQQLVDEINCTKPNVLTSLEGVPGIELDDATFPFVQTPLVGVLKDAAAAAKTKLVVNSALRTLPQQYLLTLWGAKRRCKIRLVARPGTSNHESGVAVDVANHGTMKAALTKQGSCATDKLPKRACFQWKGPKDAVHFDFKGDGAVDVAGESTRAFQRLWSRNNPTDKLAETGVFDKETEARLKKAPAAGFPKGPECGGVAVALAADAGTEGGAGSPSGLPLAPPAPDEPEATEESDE